MPHRCHADADVNTDANTYAIVDIDADADAADTTNKVDIADAKPSRDPVDHLPVDGIP